MADKKIILLDSSYPINSRNKRIFNYLEKKYNIMVITWDRKGETGKHDKNYYVYNKKINYGHKFKKLICLPLYLLYIDSIIKKLKPDIIIASNWDMLILASMLKLRYKKSFKLIYENRDMVTSKYKMVKKILENIEKRALANTDAMILASRFFKSRYEKFKKEKIIVENKVPSSVSKYEKEFSENMRISFIGTVRFYNIIINLIEAAKDISGLEIHIYGDGPDRSKILNYIEKKKINNVYIHGPFDYLNIGKIYSKTDVVWSVYPNTSNSNKKYVIPNKFFECLYFQTPGIFPRKTKIGDLIEQYDIGYTVDPYSISAIKKLLLYILNSSNINAKIYSLINSDISYLWDDDIKALGKLLEK